MPFVEGLTVLMHQVMREHGGRQRVYTLDRVLMNDSSWGRPTNVISEVYGYIGMDELQFVSRSVGQGKQLMYDLY